MRGKKQTAAVVLAVIFAVTAGYAAQYGIRGDGQHRECAGSRRSGR